MRSHTPICVCECVSAYIHASTHRHMHTHTHTYKGLVWSQTDIMETQRQTS